MATAHGFYRQYRQKATDQNKRTSVPLLQSDISILLALPLRLQYLPGLHACKPVGNDL